MSKLYFERIFYYWRLSMYGHVHALCNEFLKESGVDPLFLIWDALASGAEGKTSIGLATLERITNRVAMGLPIAVAQLNIHKMAKMQDFTSIGQLETEIEQLQKSANASAVVQAAQILWLTGNATQAINFVHPLTTQSPANKSANALVGWIKLSAADRNSGRWFDMASADSAVSNRAPDPFVLYGKAMYFANVSRWQDALQNLVQLAGICEFPEAALERARIYIAMNNWDLAMETAAESVGHYVSDCDYELMCSIHALSQTGDLEAAKSSIKNLLNLINKYENENSVYTLNVVKLLISLSWRDHDIVVNCLNSFNSVARAHPETPEVQITHGRILLYAERYQEAKEAFNSALTQVSDSISALTGLISVQIALKQMSDAGNQLEFLEAMVGDQGAPLELIAMKCQYLRTNNLPVDIDGLVFAMRRHVENVQQIFTPQSARPVSTDDAFQNGFPIDHYLENYIQLDLGTFANALTEAMFNCNTLERTVADPKNGPICDLIARILEYIPGAIPFSYYLAVLAFGEGRYAQATRAIQAVLNSHWGFNASQCHLLLAQIRLQMKQFDDAEAALSRAVSYDFNIRSSLRYNMISAQLNDARGQFDKAVETLNGLMKSPEYEQAPSNEKVNVSLFLAHALRRLKKNDEAQRVVTDALNSWHGTPDEDRIKLFQAQLLSGIGKIHEGLDILESFEPTNPQYTKAKKTAAKIYLTKLNDKNTYIRCFKQMVQSVPSKTNFVLLGDALLKVKRFDEAVQFFHSALNSDPSDQTVALHLARALLIVHDYDSAINAYLHAIQVGNNDPHSQLELCRAFVKLRRLEEARDLAMEAMQNIDAESGDWESQAASADFYELLSIIDAKNGETEQSSEELNDALSLYERLTQQGRVDIPGDSVAQLKIKAAALYQKAAEMCLQRDDTQSAVEAYEKALDLDPGSSKILLALGRLHLDRGENDKCRDVCQQLLRADVNCEDAALMLADVSSSDTVEDLEEAFSRSPTFYRTLVRLIEKCARAGELDRVPQLFEKCPTECAGLYFCKGLYNVYMGLPQPALNFFNKCRPDPEWGTQALILIFMIYANPNRKFVWCETKPLATAKDLEAAKKILGKFDPTIIDIPQYQAQLLLSQNTQDSIQQALEIYKESDDNDLNATIGKCKCFLRLDRQRDATRHLNGIIHGEPTHANFSVFVESFLMMTYISIKENQIDEAEKYVDRALDLNRSCGKAWEMRALLYEKKKEYLAAADAFKQAWDLSGHTDLGIGFKLAVNYMKGEDPVDAIKVSRTILALHPNYPKLKETVFMPCCALLKT